MKGLRSARETIEILRRTKIALWDKKTNEILDTVVLDLLLDYILYGKTDEEFEASIEVVRFAKSISDYISEGRDEDTQFEFYKQHKKEIDSNKSKQTVFKKKFKIDNFAAFKQEFKDRYLYLEPFYDEKLRALIIEEQEYKCGMCNRDIAEINPHLHHIDYNKRNCSKKNLIFLCPRCHGKTNSNREFWRDMLEQKKA
jgi:hypothetical protein